MKKILHLLIALLPLITSAQSSHDIDSLKIIVQAGREDTTTINTIKALCIKLMEIGNFSEAKSYAEKELALSIKIKYGRGEGNAYMQIGNADSWLGNYADASRSYFMALKVREKINDVRGTASAYMNLGNVELYRNNYQDAIDNYLHSMEMQKKINNKAGIADCYQNIAIVFDSQNKFSEAIDNYLLALQLYEELESKSAIAYVYWGMAEAYLKQSDYGSAEKNYTKSLNMMEAINDTKGIAGLYSDMGVSYIKQKKYTEAKRILNEAVLLSKKTGDKNTTKASYEALSKTDSATTNYKSAYENYKMFSQYKDSLFNEASTKKLVQNQMQYEFGKKEDAIKAEQNKKDAITAQEKQKQKIIIYSIAGGLLLAIMFAIFIFSSLNITRKQKHLIELQRNEVSRQKGVIEERNNEITASIRYALRVQQAVLPSESLIKSIMPEYFLIFEPKEILSGDSYYVDKVGDKILWASLDYTGHGISPSLLGTIGNNILSGIIKDGEIVPSKILDKLNSRFNESLHKTDDSSIRDGMDMSICVWDKKEMTLNYAGANHPLWIIKKETSELLELRPDKKAIGSMDATHYTNHEIKLQSGDCIFSFSDGVADLHSRDNKKFMKKRLRELLLSVHRESMEQQREIICNALHEYCDGAERVDDVLLFGVKI